jgi:uncharacterized membrane protein YGL010W
MPVTWVIFLRCIFRVFYFNLYIFNTPLLIVMLDYQMQSIVEQSKNALVRQKYNLVLVG